MKTSQSLLELFDSLGATKEYILSKIPKLGKSVIYNTSAIQSKKSSRCGEFCVSFALFRLHSLDHTFEECLNDFFSTDLNQNEKIALTFLQDE